MAVASMRSALTPSFGTGAFAEVQLSADQFATVAAMIYDHAGINMRAGKEGLVRARLSKRLRALALTDYDEYLAFVSSPSGRSEFTHMVDALTTNKTSFLREVAHFEFLRDQVFPKLTGPVRLWSAGCSSGEEPYTMAMLLNETFSNARARDIRILATDISERVLGTASTGAYNADAMTDVPAAWMQKYWKRHRSDTRDVYQAGAELRRMIHFAKLNLMDKWPMKGPFDAILCRNVMIYFDKLTQEKLVARYHALLKPGGFLFVGHSESLTGITHGFRYVQPAVYVK